MSTWKNVYKLHKTGSGIGEMVKVMLCQVWARLDDEELNKLNGSIVPLRPNDIRLESWEFCAKFRSEREERTPCEGG